MTTLTVSIKNTGALMPEDICLTSIELHGIKTNVGYLTRKLNRFGTINLVVNEDTYYGCDEDFFYIIEEYMNELGYTEIFYNEDLNQFEIKDLSVDDLRSVIRKMTMEAEKKRNELWHNSEDMDDIYDIDVCGNCVCVF